MCGEDKISEYYIDCRQNCETKDFKEEELHHELLTIRSSRGQCSKEWFRRVLPDTRMLHVGPLWTKHAMEPFEVEKVKSRSSTDTTLQYRFFSIFWHKD